MKADGTYPAGYGKVSIPLQPKAIHDEMNASSFDEFGRMQANLGVEVVPANPGAQNVVLIPYTGSPTEVIDASKLPSVDLKVAPIAVNDDGTQIWKITHNGVDTHPIHFHLYDVQLINRVTWDNIIIPPDANELGWKDTVRVSPLEDTLVALRPIVPKLPFDIPNSVRELSPMMPDGAELFPGLMADPQGNPINVFNHLINFGWEYVYHCHILSHEEMDMMRPVLVAVPPVAPSGLVFDGATLSWTDNSLSETAFVVEKSTDGVAWSEAGRIDRILGEPNTTGEVLTWVDPTPVAGDQYRAFAENTVGDTEVAGFPIVITKSAYAYVEAPAAPAAPSNLTATLLAGPQVSLAWTDNASNETNYVVERSVDGFATVQSVTLGPNSTTYGDTSVGLDTAYAYRVCAFNGTGNSPTSNVATVTTPPLAPSGVVATASRQGNRARVVLNWADNATYETGFEIQRARDLAFTQELVTASVPANSTSFNTGLVLTRNTDYDFRVRSFNTAGSSAWADATPFPVRTP